MEQIKSHPVKDVYRITDGLLIEIHKYERIGNVWMQQNKQKLFEVVQDYVY
ncbi:TPA: hypothetical protein ACTZ3A_000930 [Bacillus cereus]